MRLLISFLCVILLGACSTHSNSLSSNQNSQNPKEYQIGAYLWQQTSGEYRALTYQAYNIAREKVARDLENKHNKKRAVIFDIDETVLDNSIGGAREIKGALPWKESNFSDWVKLKEAVAIPGALEFINYLVQNQVEVFYLSNRHEKMFNDTYENLVAQKFPVKKENIMLYSGAGDYSKEKRRLEVQKKYEIILLVGDNLSDFDKDFDRKSVAERNSTVDLRKADFGERFIMLPNPLYGDWERALPQDKSRVDNLKITP